MKTLYLDCFSGVSGDMLLGAMLDLGLPIEALRRALGTLAIERLDVGVERVTRGGIAAAKFWVNDHEHADAAQHGHGHHHTLAEIVRLIDQSGLSTAGRDRAGSLFRRLAEVEAGVHGMSVDQVHLHEVGALDSIVDIVGAVFAFEWLAPARIVSSALNVGQGTVRTAHGVLPVPAPATIELLKGAPVYADGPQMELVTPTGALLVTAYAQEFGPLPAMRVDAVGHGAGDHDPAGRANVLRLIVGDAGDAGTSERVALLECEIDDMNPQIFGVLMDDLLAAGALDVFYAPIQMKKNRPATLVTVVARPGDREALSAILFHQTTTLGLRYQETSRERLERVSIVVQTPVGAIRFKVARRHGVVMNAAAEFDDCARIAGERGMAVKEVQAIAMKAYLDAPRP